MKTLRYKVSFSGFVYIEAESPTEEFEMAQDDCTVYEEKEFSAPEEIDEFYVELWKINFILKYRDVPHQ